VLGACDLQPPPKRSAPATSPTPATPSAAGTEPAPPAPPAAGGAPSPADAGTPVADAQLEVTSECLQVAAHIADVMIRETTDPAQRAALEQDKTKIVRRSAEGCTRDAWSESARSCFLAAKAIPQMQECGKNLRAP
jgi:hypothetical protein